MSDIKNGDIIKVYYYRLYSKKLSDGYGRDDIDIALRYLEGAKTVAIGFYEELSKDADVIRVISVPHKQDGATDILKRHIMKIEKLKVVGDE